MALKLITPPKMEPLTLEEVKLHIRVDGNDEDSLIISLIKVAREYCEDFQRRVYVTQTWELVLDSFPTFPILPIEIPKAPLKEIENIKYIDKDSVEYIFSSTEYIVDTNSEPGRIVPAFGKTWPQTIQQPVSSVKIRFTAGYGDASLVPERVKQAMKLLIGHWYQNREEVNIGTPANEVPFAAKMLLSQDRMVLV